MGGSLVSPGLATQRERGLNCQQKEVLSNQRGLQRTKRGGGPKTPLCKGKGPENPGVVAPFAVCGLSRQPHARIRVCFDKVVVVPVVLCNGVPQVQSVSLSVASERHVTSMTVVSAQTTVEVPQLLEVPVGESAGAVLGRV